MVNTATNTATVLGMKSELYKFITNTLIVVDVCLVITLTYTSSHPLVTFFLYISFPIIAILVMKLMERINKLFPFVIFCSVSPLILGALCYYSGLPSPAWLTTFPLITITLLLLDSLALKMIFLILYMTSLIAAYLLLKMEMADVFFKILALGIYSAVLDRCLNYFQIQQMRIEKQKKLIEEKNEDILDSIRYAKRIQTSLLPTEKYIERVLPKKTK